jgi:hypothetical protein
MLRENRSGIKSVGREAGCRLDSRARSGAADFWSDSGQRTRILHVCKATPEILHPAGHSAFARFRAAPYTGAKAGKRPPTWGIPE